MENQTNINPTVYIGDGMVYRRECSKDPNIVSKLMSIKSVEERAGGGLILYLIGSDKKQCSFEFEKINREPGKNALKGESVRRQFLDDIGVWDIFNNVCPENHQSLVTRNLEVFMRKNSGKIVGVSPIFRRGGYNEVFKNSLENYFIGGIERMDEIYEGLNKKKRELDVKTLSETKRRVEEELKTAPSLFRSYCNAGGSLDFIPYNQYLEAVEDLLQLTNNLIEQESLDASEGF